MKTQDDLDIWTMLDGILQCNLWVLLSLPLEVAQTIREEPNYTMYESNHGRQPYYSLLFPLFYIYPKVEKKKYQRIIVLCLFLL